MVLIPEGLNEFPIVPLYFVETPDHVPTAKVPSHLHLVSTLPILLLLCTM